MAQGRGAAPGKAAWPIVEIAETLHRALPKPPPRVASVDYRHRWLERLLSLAGPAVATLDEVGVAEVMQALSDTTVRARANDLASFAAFCAVGGRRAIPATSATLVAYADGLADTQKVTTIERKLSSITASHRLLGLDNPCSDAAVRDVVRAIRKGRGVARRQALAVRLGSGQPDGAPTITLAALLAGCGDDPRGRRDAALVSVAYDGGLRASEVIAARVEDIEAQEDGSAALRIAPSKAGQEAAFVVLSPDTVERLQHWLRVAEIANGTIFRRLERRIGRGQPGRAARSDVELLGEGRFVVVATPAVTEVKRIVYAVEHETTPASARLSRQGLAKIYRTAARRAAEGGRIGLAGPELESAIAGFSTHGFRVGLTHDLFAEQLDVEQIQRVMRWKSPATALGYARRLMAGSNTAAQLLKRRRSGISPNDDPKR